MAMSNPWIVSLDAPCDEPAAVGSKCCNLIRLRQEGLPVPSGFCVTAEAYRRHLEHNGLAPVIQEAVRRLGAGEPAAGILAEVRQLIGEAPMEEALRGEIATHWAKLAARRVAVRSSATAEDMPEHSFAGQYDTVLGVRDLGCVGAVKRCWASLWTERAYEYRARNGFDHPGVSMAVIVQSLIEADASGVMFTADPVKADGSCVVIESCFGLGEALVAGRVTPDRFVVAKGRSKSISQTVAEKTIRIISDGSGGTVQEAVPEDLRQAASIDERVCRRLADYAVRAEKVFGGPQDMEWAVRGNEIHILQSRPITTTVRQKTWEDRQAWTNANTGEVAPDVMTPLTWSLISLLVDSIFRSVARILCMRVSAKDFFGLVAGRVYMNLNTISAAFRYVGAARGLEKLFGGYQNKLHECGRLEIGPEDLPDVGGSRLKMILRLPISAVEMLAAGDAKRRKSLELIGRVTERLNSVDIETAGAETIAANLRAVLDMLTEIDLLCLLTGMGSAIGLQVLCARWLADENGRIFNRVVSGIEGMEDAEAGYALNRLAAQANADQGVRQMLLAEHAWPEVRDHLQRSEQGRAFLRAWDDFMVENGHHCRGEIELKNARWNEDPDYVLGLLRSYMASDPAESQGRRRSMMLEREHVLAECRAKLGPLKRRIFMRWVKKAQEGCLFRQNSKNRMVRLLAGVRHVLLGIGTKLAENGVLSERDDIFSLEWCELEAAVRGSVDLDVRAVIAARRAEYARNQELRPPPVVVGRFDPNLCTSPSVDTNARTLEGMAVSPGVAMGLARVILHASDETVGAGEILVAPFTDPGWTPYFVNAAAVVMDIGGLLSHGSIVAREFGIPAVVNVGPATQIIKTGQRIQVDGNTGVVRILAD